ncbi:MAG: hypothetical protein ACC618_01155 [Patescibacteria group bacterium]
MTEEPGASGETEVSPGSIIYLEDKKGKVKSGESIVPDVLYDQERKTLSLEKKENSIRKDSLQPDKRLERGLELARRFVNRLNKMVGISEVDPQKMEILLLSKESYGKHYKSVTGKDPGKSCGLMMDLVKPVLVEKGNYPDYILASFATHELIHKRTETHVRAFHTESEPVGDKGLITVETTFTEERRYGLMVAKLKREGGKVVETQFTGELLNELPNYLFQGAFIDELLTGEEGREIFKDEIEKREERLRGFSSEDYTYLIAPLKDGSGREIRIDRPNVHFDKKGNLLINQASFVVRQLADDLSNLVGAVEGETFGQVLLKAKVEPKIQGKIRKAVDSKMGKGFYRRLKNAKVEDGLNLLVEVQSKLYVEKLDEVPTN